VARVPQDFASRKDLQQPRLFFKPHTLEGMAEMHTTRAEPWVPTNTVGTRASSSRPIGSIGSRRSLLWAAAGAASTLLTALDREIPLATAATVAALVPAVVVDIREHRLPNRLVGAAALIGLVCVLITMASGATLDLLGLLVGAAAMSAPLLLLHLVSPNAMGFGDVKMAVVLGAALGLVAPVLVPVALVIASAGSAAVAITLRRSTIAFGPGLLSGAILALCLAIAPVGGVDTVLTSGSVVRR
jgi:leader peptidase (prepilin peptidase) / N-methyltransferase